MALFVVEHRHPADRCPAGDPKAGRMLLQHMASAKTFGLAVHGEAVVNGAHTLYMILEAPDREAIRRFMQPFTQVGTVEILPASSCESVITRGGCGAA